jgi:serine/threonine-protein kinase
MVQGVPDDKRTRIGATGPVRPQAGAGRAVAAVTPVPVTPAPVTPAPVTPAPITGSAAGHPTSYLSPQVDPLLGQTLAGRYLIQKKLGEGGMGAVYLATHNLLEKQVALKVLHAELARKPDLVERFMQEAKSASRIRHENVIDISDFGTTPEGLVFFAMELLKGHDLHEEIARARMAGQLLPWERCKRIFLQICSALGAAHALGIVHRDLKPENIYLVDFLGDPDFVKLLDFGIAKQTEVAEGERKLTRTGMLFGTPEYMSPEQARGETVDQRVDVYAMGCILFQLVTGRVPFEAENFMGVLTMHLTEPPPVIPPEIFDSIGAPRAIAGVIDQALAKDRNQRFPSIDELVRAVRRVSGDKPTGPVSAQASVPAPRSGSTTGRVKTQWTGNLSIPELDAAAPPPRSKLPMILGAIVLAAGAAGAAAYFASRGSPPSGNGNATSATGNGSAGGNAGASGNGSTSGSQGVATAPPVTPPPTQARVDPAPGDPTLMFKWSHIYLRSKPSDAEVKDVSSGEILGRTPVRFELTPSRQKRQFALYRKGSGGAVVELVPDLENIERTANLVQGTIGRPVINKVPDPGTKPPPTGSATSKPDQAPGKPEVPPPGKPETPTPGNVARPASPPKPDDDSIDPVLKAFPSRAGSGAGSAPGSP